MSKSAQKQLVSLCITYLGSLGRRSPQIDGCRCSKIAINKLRNIHVIIQDYTFCEHMLALLTNHATQLKDYILYLGIACLAFFDAADT